MEPAAPSASPRRRLVPPLLREEPGFRRYFAAQTISFVGDQITLIALPLLAILALDAGPAQMGYLTAAGMAPNLLFAVHAGAWVDRAGRRRLTMIGADLGRAAAIVTIPVAYALGALTFGHLLGVAFLMGTLSMLFFVSQGTLFVSVVPRGRYVEANQLVYGSRSLSFIAGPSIGGVVVQVFSAAAALTLDAVTFLISAVFLGRIRATEPPAETASRGHVRAGIRFIRQTPTMRAVLGAAATINFFNFVFWALFVLYATRALGLPPGILGAVFAAGAAGGAIGTVVTGRIGRRIGIGPALILGCILFPAPLLLVPLAGGPRPLVLTMLFAAEFLSGIGLMVLDISASSIFAAVIPDRLRARVTGAHLAVNYGVRPLGSLAGGALGSTLGLRPTLWIATTGATLGFLWLLRSPVPRLRDLPEAQAEPGHVSS